MACYVRILPLSQWCQLHCRYLLYLPGQERRGLVACRCLLCLWSYARAWCCFSQMLSSVASFCLLSLALGSFCMAKPHLVFGSEGSFVSGWLHCLCCFASLFGSPHITHLSCRVFYLFPGIIFHLKPRVCSTSFFSLIAEGPQAR